jgi:phosphoglycerate dehydrogenase-like enzyme
MSEAGDRRVNVLITFALEPELVQQIEAVDPRLDVRVLGQHARQLFRGGLRYPSELEAQTARQELEEALGDAEVLFGFWGPAFAELYPDPEALRRQAPGLRWLQLTSAGVDRAARSGLLESDLLVTNASGLHATPIGEFALCVMLMFCKGAHRFVRAQERREWSRYMSQELYGKTVGVVGLGHIGGEVARLAQAFGMRVIGCRRRRGRPRYVDEIVPPERLPDLLARSDFVVLAVPLSSETDALIGEAELRAMRPPAWLINVSRGRVIDEDALVRALTQGEIAGACLDVFREEPLPETSALWSLPNVIVTPHNSGRSPLNMERATEIFVDNLGRFVAGRSLRNRVRLRDL